MACGVGMVIDRGGNPEVFPEPFLKGPCRFPYVFLITIQLPHVYLKIALLFCVMLSLSLGANMMFLKVYVASLELDLDHHHATKCS